MRIAVTNRVVGNARHLKEFRTSDAPEIRAALEVAIEQAIAAGDVVDATEPRRGDGVIKIVYTARHGAFVLVADRDGSGDLVAVGGCSTSTAHNLINTGVWVPR